MHRIFIYNSKHAVHLKHMAPAIFSASVAISLFVLTQFWTWARSRSDRLKQKHEDLMTALFGIFHVIQPIPEHLDSKERCSASLAKSFEILNATSRPQVLIQLYFKDAQPRFSNLQNALVKVLDVFRAGSEDPKAAYLSREEIKNITQAMSELSEYLIENVDQLTKEPTNWFRPNSW